MYVSSLCLLLFKGKEPQNRGLQLQIIMKLLHTSGIIPYFHHISKIIHNYFEATHVQYQIKHFTERIGREKD